jgi:two-component system, NarL family, nitrate/nitrite response regulator NarL
MSDDTPNIKIVMIDDHAVLRMGLKMLIESKPGFEVVGESGSPTEATGIVAQTQPDIILLDIDLGSASGVELIPRIRSMAPQARIIILTGLRDTELHMRAVRLGAMGLVLKEKADEFLLTAIERVHAGEVWLSRAVIGSVFAELLDEGSPEEVDPDAQLIDSLTAREREVIALLSEGLRNKQIGERLFISETTVRHHLSSVFSKLGVSSRFELIMYAQRHGLADPPPLTNR